MHWLAFIKYPPPKIKFSAHYLDVVPSRPSLRDRFIKDKGGQLFLIRIKIGIYFYSQQNTLEGETERGFDGLRLITETF